MTSIPFVRLREPGESITLAVQECKKLEVGKFPGVGFIGMDGANKVVVEVPESSADRQLERLGHTRESIVGRSVTISRAENHKDASKPYWNIALANGVHATPKASVAELGGPIAGLDDLPDEPPPVEEAYAPAPATNGVAKLDALFNLYDVCFEHAVGIARKAHGLNPDVAAVAATLFIQANQRGIR